MRRLWKDVGDIKMSDFCLLAWCRLSKVLAIFRTTGVPFVIHKPILTSPPFMSVSWSWWVYYFMFLKICLFVYSFERQSKRELFHPMFHEPNCLQQPRLRSPSQELHPPLHKAERDSSTWTVLHFLQGALAASLMAREGAGTPSQALCYRSGVPRA